MSELVYESSDDMLAVDYMGLIPLMISTIKKQNRRIKELENKVDKLIELVNV